MDMLNEDLMTSENVRVAKLQQRVRRLEEALAAFKKYDEERKAYYNGLMTKLGTLEAYVQELEDGTEIARLKRLNLEYKRQAGVLAKKVFLSKVADLSDVETVSLFTVCELKARIKERDKIIRVLREANDALIARLNKDER